MPRTPKTIRIDDLRQRLGDETVDQLLVGLGRKEAARGPARITRDQLDRTVALVNGQAVGNARRAWIGTVPVFRQYFAESAQRRRFLNEWAQRIRDSLPEKGSDGRGRRRRAATAE